LDLVRRLECGVFRRFRAQNGTMFSRPVPLGLRSPILLTSAATGLIFSVRAFMT